MGIGFAAILIMAVLLGICFMAYRRQVKRTCRYLAFIKDHETNMKLAKESPFSEMNALVGEINAVLEKYESMEKQVKQRETVFKETITNISHDIRTPLTSMEGYLKLCRECETKEERERYIAIIRERLSCLNRMLEELFTYTKLQDTRYEIELEKTDFGRCVYETVFSFYEECRAKGIEPLVSFSEELVYVQGNAEALKRVFRNVIKNALDHGGEYISLSLYTEGNSICFGCANSVAENIKIDTKKVFERFYKADAARTHTSTGLGLSIAKGLVEKMGGSIRAETEEKEKQQIFSVFISFPVL